MGPMSAHASRSVAMTEATAASSKASFVCDGENNNAAAEDSDVKCDAEDGDWVDGENADAEDDVQEDGVEDAEDDDEDEDDDGEEASR